MLLVAQEITSLIKEMCLVTIKLSIFSTRTLLSQLTRLLEAPSCRMLVTLRTLWLFHHHLLCKESLSTELLPKKLISRNQPLMLNSSSIKRRRLKTSRKSMPYSWKSMRHLSLSQTAVKTWEIRWFVDSKLKLSLTNILMKISERSKPKFISLKSDKNSTMKLWFMKKHTSSLFLLSKNINCPLWEQPLSNSTLKLIIDLSRTLLHPMTSRQSCQRCPQLMVILSSATLKTNKLWPQTTFKSTKWMLKSKKSTKCIPPWLKDNRASTKMWELSTLKMESLQLFIRKFNMLRERSKCFKINIKTLLKFILNKPDSKLKQTQDTLSWRLRVENITLECSN